MDLLSSSIARKIIRNTIFNSIGRFWSMLVALFLTPYIFSKLGVQGFGAWSLVLVVIGYLGLFDFGIKASFVKYISEHYTQKDYKAINNIASTGLLFFLVLAVFITGSVFIFKDSIIGSFKIPMELHEDAGFVLLVAAIILSLSNVFGLFSAIIAGLQRMDVMNTIIIAASVPNIIGTVIFLQLGYGLRGLIINRAIVFAFTIILSIICSFKLLPSLKLSPDFLSVASLKRLLEYGLKVQVTNVGALVSLQTNKILIGYFLSLGLVAFYELGFKIAYTVTSLPMLLISAITPAASELEARKNDKLLQQLYVRGSKYLILVVAPIAFFTILTASSIMSIWMGGGYGKSALVTRLLTIGFSINLLTGVGTTMARGVGEPGYEMQYALVTIVLNILLGIALITKLGFTGVLIATLLATIIGSAYFMSLFHEYLKMPLTRFAKETYPKPIIACLLASLCVFGLHRAINFIFSQPNRLVNLAFLGLEACIFVAVYLIVILKSRCLDSYDQELLSRTARLTIFLFGS